MKFPVVQRPLAFLDVETSGLDASTHVILEVGVVKVYPNLTPMAEYQAKINPSSYGEFAVDPGAMEVNGLDLMDLIRNGQPASWVAVELGRILEGSLLVGHNVRFDWEFIRALFKRHNIQIETDYHMLDTSSMLWPLVLAGATPSMSLAKASDALGLPYESRHRALADAKQSLELYKHILARTSISMPPGPPPLTALL